jgi:hypothetical protein
MWHESKKVPQVPAVLVGAPNLDVGAQPAVISPHAHAICYGDQSRVALAKGTRMRWQSKC